MAVKYILDYHQAYTCQKIVRQCRILDDNFYGEVASDNISFYNSVSPVVGNEPEFLLYYAKAMFDARKFRQCISVLRKARLKSGDPVFFLIEGKCRQQMRQYRMAECMYRKAYYRIPHKMYPLYLLMNLYDIEGNTARTKSVAIRILSISPKVPSREFYYIRQRAKEMLLYSEKHSD